MTKVNSTSHKHSSIAHGRIVLSLSVYPFAWSVLLNKVWGLEACHLKEQTMRKNRYVRFDFSVASVSSLIKTSHTR